MENLIASISHYIKSISLFLIFTSFVGIILPNSKYKNYINVLLGLVLVIIILTPIGTLIADTNINFQKIFENTASSSTDSNINSSLTDGSEYYEKLKQDAIVKSYTSQLKIQLEALVLREGYSLFDINVSFNESTGEIYNLELSVSEKEARGIKETKEIKKPFIRIEKIEPIKIRETSKSNENIENTENDKQLEQQNFKTKELKKIISDFYNLSVDNIHITLLPLQE